jgi:hypothetical protein
VCDQIVPADDPLPVLQQVNDQVKNLRFDRDLLAAAPQFMALNVERVFAEIVSH